MTVETNAPNEEIEKSNEGKATVTNNKHEEQRESKEEINGVWKNEWMIRPCELYYEEYSDCTSIKARFHQYFIFGKNTDCSQWHTDYKNCIEWQKYKTEKAFDELIKSEKDRRITRLRGHYENDVWEKRKEPPVDWNKPLPQWLEDRNKNSYLSIRNKLAKQNADTDNNSSCSIM